MTTSHTTSHWAPSPGMGPDSGSAARLLDLYFSALLEADGRHTALVERVRPSIVKSKATL